MRKHLNTAWQGSDLVVSEDDHDIDRIPAEQIRRVVLVCRGAGDTPGDLLFALIETADDVIVLPADSGIAGRVHFERQAFWAERNCIYWVSEARATLPRRLRPGLWILRRHRPGYLRAPRSELGSAIDQWPLEGPQTWEERKWDRIARSRPLAPLEDHGRQHQQHRSK